MFDFDDLVRSLSAVITPVTATEVVTDDRFFLAGESIGCAFGVFESTVQDFSREVTKYRGRWRYFKLSNRGFFMMPDAETVKLRDYEMSAESLGIIVTMKALNSFYGSADVPDIILDQRITALMDYAVTKPDYELIMSFTY